MKDRIEAFLKDLDDNLAPHANGDRLAIFHIGRSSLVWKYGYTSTTQDVDILRAEGPLAEIAVRLFGKDCDKALRHGLYLDIVHEGLPPVPHGFASRATKVIGPWKVLDIYHLDPHDLAATKLRRFASKDREDIRLLCDSGLLEETPLDKSLQLAFIWTMEKDGDPLRDAAFANLETVKKYLRGEITEF